MFVLKSPANLLFWVCNKRFRTSVHVQQQDSFFFDFLPVFSKISVATKYIIDFRSLRSHFTSCIKKLFQSFSQWRKDNSYSYAGVQWMHCWSVIIVSSLKNYKKKTTRRVGICWPNQHIKGTWWVGTPYFLLFFLLMVCSKAALCSKSFLVTSCGHPPTGHFAFRPRLFAMCCRMASSS